MNVKLMIISREFKNQFNDFFYHRFSIHEKSLFFVFRS
jgi:hypothetical protein